MNGTFSFIIFMCAENCCSHNSKFCVQNKNINETSHSHCSNWMRKLNWLLISIFYEILERNCRCLLQVHRTQNLSMIEKFWNKNQNIRWNQSNEKYTISSRQTKWTHLWSETMHINEILKQYFGNECTCKTLLQYFAFNSKSKGVILRATIQIEKRRRKNIDIFQLFPCTFALAHPNHIVNSFGVRSLSLSVHSYSIYSNWKSSSVFGYILVIIIPMQCILHITKIRLEFRKEEILNIENSKKNKQ